MNPFAISRETAKAYTGSEILRLDLHNKQTDEYVLNQLNFAIDHSKSKGEIGYFTDEYFNIDYEKSSLLKVNSKIGNIEFNFEIPLYVTQKTASLHPEYYPNFISNTPINTTSSQKGNMFGKLEYIHQLRFNIYNTFGKKPTPENLKWQGYVPIFYNMPHLNKKPNLNNY